MVCGCAINFGIGSFLITITMISDLKSILKATNEKAKTGENQLCLLENLSQFIEMHSNVKQLRKKIMLKWFYSKWRFINADFYGFSFCQSNLRLYGNLSIDAFDYVFMEPGHNIQFYAWNGISWVKILFILFRITNFN